MNTTEISIPNNEAANKAKAKKVVLFSFGTLALGALTFFGIKQFKKHKKENNVTTDQTTDGPDNPVPVPPRTHPVPAASLPVTNAGAAVFLRLRDKGSKVLEVQRALMRDYGSNIFPKYGADGVFGTELRDFLLSKGYGVPLSETDFKKITEGKKAQAPLVTFDPAAIAKALYTAITGKDFNTAITLLKSIKDTSNYALVSEKLKELKVHGMPQTLVNAMLGNFTEASQRAKIQQAFLIMGLKYNGTQWTLNGGNGLSGAKPSFKEGTKVATTKQVLISEQGRGLMVVPANMYLGAITAIHHGIAIVSTDTAYEVRVHTQFIKEVSK
ncbi:MAG: hypothetical protein K0S33_3739 [Bacteroidetes bacterium]|nr:hypothetical protein [Bacteroidota bacterium]